MKWAISKLESCGIPFFRFRTLNFLSNFLDRRSFNFGAFASMVEQAWFRSRGDKVSWSRHATCSFIGSTPCTWLEVISFREVPNLTNLPWNGGKLVFPENLVCSTWNPETLDFRKPCHLLTWITLALALRQKRQNWKIAFLRNWTKSSLC